MIEPTEAPDGRDDRKPPRGESPPAAIPRGARVPRWRPSLPTNARSSGSGPRDNLVGLKTSASELREERRGLDSSDGSMWTEKSKFEETSKSAQQQNFTGPHGDFWRFDSRPSSHSIAASLGSCFALGMAASRRKGR